MENFRLIDEEPEGQGDQDKNVHENTVPPVQSQEDHARFEDIRARNQRPAKPLPPVSNWAKEPDNQFERLRQQVEDMQKRMPYQPRHQRRRMHWMWWVMVFVVSFGVGAGFLFGLNIDLIILQALYGFNLAAVIAAVGVTILIFVVLVQWIRLSERETDHENFDV